MRHQQDSVLFVIITFCLRLFTENGFIHCSQQESAGSENGTAHLIQNGQTGSENGLVDLIQDG